MEGSAYASELPYDPAALVDALAARLEQTAMSPADVVELLRPLLDPRPVRPLVEYVIRDRLGRGEGEHDTCFHTSDGNLRRTRGEHGPIGNDDLEAIASAR